MVTDDVAIVTTDETCTDRDSRPVRATPDHAPAGHHFRATRRVGYDTCHCEY
ncbi:hypothetical protein SAMN06265360_11835 [Haloechinothrix alba]|uniref:Uncharacterized protein n=1 Tax=Haloechinothrix alba TaxID=664784 RepID=A0A238YZV6_9PSEU|nr:hypothetical protein SAMN06265360_11835 [Haloechinothrix alba]